MKRISLGDHSMLIIGTVQGLVKEKKKVRDAFRKIRPDVVGLPISDEMLEGLEAVMDGEVKEVATNSIDDLFADHLRRFGEVQLPPPSLVEAFRLAKERSKKKSYKSSKEDSDKTVSKDSDKIVSKDSDKTVSKDPDKTVSKDSDDEEDGSIQVVTLDMDEEEYARVYTEKVSGMHFWRRIWSMSKLSKKTFVADTPEEFVVIWDRYVCRLKGYMELEKARERFMAKQAWKLLKKYERTLVLMEYERLDGVVKELEEIIKDPPEEKEECEDPEENGDTNEEPEMKNGSEAEEKESADSGTEKDEGV